MDRCDDGLTQAEVGSDLGVVGHDVKLDVVASTELSSSDVTIDAAGTIAASAAGAMELTAGAMAVDVAMDSSIRMGGGATVDVGDAMSVSSHVAGCVDWWDDDEP